MYTPQGFQNVDGLLKKLQSNKEDYWLKRGDLMALKIFHEASIRVPAYRDFLKRNKINAKKIKTIADFKNVPTVSKDSYLREYPLESLCWDGKLKEKNWTISTTSGSTGEPFIFLETLIKIGNMQSWPKCI